MKKIYSVIVGTGSYIPSKVITNQDFQSNTFYDKDGKLIDSPTNTIIEKFSEITDIRERRHADDDITSSEMAYNAANQSLEKSGIDPETLDYIIVAHNFGDIKNNSTRTDILPSLASRVKEKLGIKNPKTIAYDLIFGCPGWVQGIIQADYYIRSGDAKRVMVIGSDSLSRVSDPHDRDSMIYADGAGATILEGVESEVPIGILTHAARTDTNGQTYNLFLGSSFKPGNESDDLYIKMQGHKIYEYALKYVPSLVQEGLEKAGIGLKDVTKVLIHQANAKMDEAILKRIFKLYHETHIPENIMPMTIGTLGNSSVATVPTLLDLILSDKMAGHQLKAGDIAVFASVGAGMNINAIIYKFPN